MKRRQATISLAYIWGRLGIELVHRKRPRYLGYSTDILFEVVVIQAHELRAQQRLRVIHTEIATGAMLDRYAQWTDRGVGRPEIDRLGDRLLGRIKSQIQGIDMRTPEIAIGDSIIQLQCRVIRRLFRHDFIVSEGWHEAQMGKEGSKGDDCLLVDVG